MVTCGKEMIRIHPGEVRVGSTKDYLSYRKVVIAGICLRHKSCLTVSDCAVIQTRCVSDNNTHCWDPSSGLPYSNQGTVLSHASYQVPEKRLAPL